MNKEKEKRLFLYILALHFLCLLYALDQCTISNVITCKAYFLLPSYNYNLYKKLYVSGLYIKVMDFKAHFTIIGRAKTKIITMVCIYLCVQ